MKLCKCTEYWATASQAHGPEMLRVPFSQHLLHKSLWHYPLFYLGQHKVKARNTSWEDKGLQILVVTMRISPLISVGF